MRPVMTQLTLFQNSLADDICHTHLGEEANAREPRNRRLGLVLMIGTAVLFYGAVGALIWRLI